MTQKTKDQPAEMLDADELKGNGRSNQALPSIWAGNHGDNTARVGPKATHAAPKTRRPLQFNWRRQWNQKVAPYLQEELVQFSLDLGMEMFDPDWQRGDAPCDIGALGSKRIVKGKLSWYQPPGQCHYIAFFSMAIGVLNYPDLDWRFVSGDLHTIPVGYDAQGRPRVVMDILLFAFFDAEESLAFTRRSAPPTSPEVIQQWDNRFQDYITRIVPQLQARARELRQARAQDDKASLAITSLC
jgi:hypothetical protein